MKLEVFKRKAIRLPKQSYQGQRVISITICCEKKGIVFDSEQLVKFHLDILNELLREKNGKLWAYCFMPDHVHFLIDASSGADVLWIIKLYKQKTGFAYKKQTDRALWQKSWFDHTLRQDEDIEKVIHYIFENPVRKGLVGDFKEYPFLGTGVEEVKQHLNWGLDV